MEIVDLRVHRVRVPRTYQTKVAPAGGHGEGKEASEYALIELMADEGAVGLGEISDIEADWEPIDWGDLEGRLSDVLLGASAARRHEIVERVRETIPGSFHRELSRSIVASIETALIDVAARTYGGPFCELLGGARRRCLEVTWVAFIRGTEELEVELREKADQGFRSFKLKVGGDAALDVERVKLAREVAGVDAHIRLDASGEWDDVEAADRIRELADVGADAVETPIRQVARQIAKNSPETVSDHAQDVAAALAKVKDASPIPIIEHVADFADTFAVALVAQRAVDVFNVVPVQAGGPTRALRLVQLAEAAGMDALLGSTVELSPGTSMALHVGAASAGITMASDLVGPGLLSDDVCLDPLQYQDGELRVMESSGLGVVLDIEKIEALAV